MTEIWESVWEKPRIVCPAAVWFGNGCCAGKDTGIVVDGKSDRSHLVREQLKVGLVFCLFYACDVLVKQTDVSKEPLPWIVTEGS